MPFANRRALPQPEPGQSIFSGREKELGLYRLHFHRAKDNPQVRLITAITGPGGVGKTRLLDELEWHQPAQTIYSRIDRTATVGPDAPRLMRAIADNLHRDGEPIPTPGFDQLYRRRQSLLELALKRSTDPQQILHHFYQPALLGLNAGQPVIVSPDASQFADLRWSKDDFSLAFEHPVELLTEALVADLNNATGSAAYALESKGASEPPAGPHRGPRAQTSGHTA